MFAPIGSTLLCCFIGTRNYPQHRPFRVKEELRTRVRAVISKPQTVWMQCSEVVGIRGQSFKFRGSMSPCSPRRTCQATTFVCCVAPASVTASSAPMAAAVIGQQLGRRTWEGKYLPHHTTYSGSTPTRKSTRKKKVGFR